VHFCELSFEFDEQEFSLRVRVVTDEEHFESD